MSTITKTNPLDVLPLPARDKKFLAKTLDMLPDGNEGVSEYDFEEYVSSPRGYETWRYWKEARTTPVVWFPNRQTTLTLEDVGCFDPVPTYDEVMEALEQAVVAWGLEEE